MRFYSLLCTILIVVSGCTSSRQVTSIKDDGKLELQFLQINDVYEIAPISGGREGGMARVAALKKKYLATNPNTLLVMAGDFLSPSVYNSLRNNGKRIRGQQMIEAMNVAGMDIAMFGNHEFDITEEELQSRLNESAFDWVSTNTFHKSGNEIKPFTISRNSGNSSIPAYKILQLRDRDGTTARIGIIAITLTYNKAQYVHYTDPLTTASDTYNRIKDSCDAVVAITHQSLEDDILLATKVPGLAAILGGHEHDMRFEKVGNIYITKAHANAKSAYLVNLLIDKHARKTIVTPSLIPINQTIPFDSAAAAVVGKWMKVAEENYASLGFEAMKVVMAAGDSLNGREDYIRTRPTNFTDVIVRSISFASPESNVVIMNGGSIRLDDVIYPPITEFDILRSLPFGGSIREVEMKGSLLERVLNVGRSNYSNGGFLHSFPTAFDTVTSVWKIRDEVIEPGKTYRVAMPDFLLSGMEANLDFLNDKNPDVLRVFPEETSTSNPKSDIRLAIIRYLQDRKN